MGLSQEAAGRKHGWRSGLEKAVASILADNYGGDWGYEVASIPFVQPAKERKYTPDFFLANGIIIETKGRWMRGDRMKMLMVQEQHPNLDIRFVFSNARSRISKKSKTTYAAYCERYGFLYAHKVVPKAWLAEPPEAVRVAAMEAIIEGG